MVFTSLKINAYQASCEEFAKIMQIIGFKKIFDELDDKVVYAFTNNSKGGPIKRISYNPDYVNVKAVIEVNADELCEFGPKQIQFAISEFLYCEAPIDSYAIEVVRSKKDSKHKYAISIKYTVTM